MSSARTGTIEASRPEPSCHSSSYAPSSSSANRSMTTNPSVVHAVEQSPTRYCSTTAVVEAKHLGGQPEHQPMRPPVGQVEETVEVALNQAVRIGLQFAPLVVVDEAGRRDQGSCRDGAQVGLRVGGQRLIDRYELVVLVFAHREQSSAVWT